jgi:glutaminase
MQIKDIILAEDEQVELRTSERTLFLTVILQALLDATKPRYDGEPTNSIIERERAIAWFFASVGVTAEDFHAVCDYAGVNPVYMREFAFKVLKSGEVEYVRKRINAVLGHE